MKYSSLISGLAGSLALTLFHQALKKRVSHAPRMDKLGRQGLKKVLKASGIPIPPRDQLKQITMAGDIIGNAGYYALVGTNRKHPLFTGAALGLTAGIGAIVLPEKIGLKKKYSNATSKTQWLTILIYLTGGLVAGSVYKLLEEND